MAKKTLKGKHSLNCQFNDPYLTKNLGFSMNCGKYWDNICNNLKTKSIGGDLLFYYKNMQVGYKSYFRSNIINLISSSNYLRSNEILPS